jgi:hypothetical protein
LSLRKKTKQSWTRRWLREALIKPSTRTMLASKWLVDGDRDAPDNIRLPAEF